MSHLWDLGHRKAVLITYSTDPVICSQQKTPYVRIAQSLGYSNFSSDDVLIIPSDFEQLSDAEYTECIISALNSKPTAVVTWDEFLAQHLRSECIRRGMKVPEDISLTAMIDPSPGLPILQLTTTNAFSMIREETRIASEMLERAINGREENIEQERIIVNPSLVLGNSTGPVAGKKLRSRVSPITSDKPVSKAYVAKDRNRQMTAETG